MGGPGSGKRPCQLTEVQICVVATILLNKLATIEELAAVYKCANSTILRIVRKNFKNWPTRPYRKKLRETA